ncbi:DNA polymerase alpha catalytic subunit [Trichinella pseudospiralis]|uniref:DNA polymerase n=1 Tax=Trichinella pseudospiralis TaxID=6337 RepID=A0A0V1JTM0_TRIPS|nr:DNA polymerase alpha catalytic subunit [Trichinella pseudospiralis]
MDRPKREKKVNEARASALQRLAETKQKGEKHHLETAETHEDIFEEVDEQEYQERRRQRQNNYWIDDDGEGEQYYDDGRDLYDESESDDDDGCYVESVGGKTGRAKALQNFKRKDTLENYFHRRPTKTKASEVDLESDDVLKQYLNEMDEEDQLQQASSSSSACPLSSELIGTFAPKIEASEPSKVAKSLKRGSSVFKDEDENTGKKLLRKEFDLVMSTEDSSSEVTPVEQAPLESMSNFVGLDDIDEDAPWIEQLFDSDFENFPTETEVKPSVEEIVGFPLTESNVGSDFEDSIQTAAVKASAAAQQQHTDEKIPVMPASEQFSDLVIPNVVDVPDEETTAFPVNLKLSDISTEEEGGHEVVNFYYLDAVEAGKKHPGIVYLFGKVQHLVQKSWISCCLIVKNILRRIWILPRQTDLQTNEPVKFEEVHQELTELMNKLKIDEFRIKAVGKKFWLNSDQYSQEAVYLELRYSFKYPALEANLTGKTFQAIYGTTSSELELLILETNIKGPRLMKITNPTMADNQRTWCAIELIVNSSNIVPENVNSLPPLRVLAINFLTMPDPKTHHNEAFLTFTFSIFIVMVGLLSNDNLDLNNETSALEQRWRHTCVIAKRPDLMFPSNFKSTLMDQKKTTVVILNNERAILSAVLTKILKIDPDIIVGHELLDFHLFNFINRAVTLQVPYPSRISRLKNVTQTKQKTVFQTKSLLQQLTAGRMLCDAKVLAKELIRAKDFSLQEMALEIFNERIEEILPQTIKNYFTSSTSLMHLVVKVLADAFLCWRICEKLCCLQLAIEITRAVGGVLSKTLLGGRAERTEYLLLHAFDAQNYVYPEKVSHAGKQRALTGLEDEEIIIGSKKASYAGGLVLDPKKGLYDRIVLLLDFNSLYPSIIQEFNICFTTVDLSSFNDPIKGNDEALPEIPDPAVPAGILPKEIKRLVESRRQLKSLMKPGIPAELFQQYYIRQQALKITANSVYGCLGFAASRFYAKPLAALITAKGREILTNTKLAVEKLGLEVIYGDTDSIMINSNLTSIDDALAMGKKIKAEMNKRFKLLELDIDGIYKKLLLLKKKKYAALSCEKRPDGSWQFKKEVKGLDIVRRDWSPIAIEAGNYVINSILSDFTSDETAARIREYLVKLTSDIRRNKVVLGKFIIRKQLAKSPDEYLDAKGQPHVAVALRMNEKGSHFRQGDVIPYAICLDQTTNQAMQRAYHFNEIQQGNMQIDFDYYLAQQIHPVVSRLCEPIESLDAACLADWLGLKSASSYAKQSNFTVPTTDLATVSSSCSFFDHSYAEPFTVPCVECGQIIEVTSLFSDTENIKLALSKCPYGDCSFQPATNRQYLVSLLRNQIHKHVQQYYLGWYICDDSTCRYRSRYVVMKLNSEGKLICPKCPSGILIREMLCFQYSEKKLYNQLCFYYTIFDFPRALMRLSKAKKQLARLLPKLHLSVYETLATHACNVLNDNAYGTINLSAVLKFYPKR